MVEWICEIALCPNQTIVTHISRLHAHVIQPTRNSARPQPNCRLLHAAASNSDSKRLTNKLFHFVHILSIYSQFSATISPALNLQALLWLSAVPTDCKRTKQIPGEFIFCCQRTSKQYRRPLSTPPRCCIWYTSQT